MSKHCQLFITVAISVVLLLVGPVRAANLLDTTFGLNGRVAVELGGKNSGHAVVAQPDGKIVIAGSSSKENALNISLLRFNPNGSLDTSFNGDGSVITSLAAGDDEALALGLLSDGRIVAAGYAYNGRDRDLALICYRPDGSLDGSFGDAGVVLTSIGNGNEEIAALSVSAADMITVVGSTEGTVGRILVAARYDANGEPDPGFGEQGISLIGVGEDASAEGIVERDDGTYVISGSYLEKKKSSALLVGLKGDGTLDTGFGEKGVAIPAGNFTASEGYGVVVDRAGRIYVAGSVGLPGTRESALFRFTPQGSADTTFGDRGVVVTRVSKEDNVLYDVDIGPGGVAASGFTTDAGTRQFLLLTFSPDGFATGAVTAGQQAGKGAEPPGSEGAPVQEVRVNGKTRVQIRRLQMWSNAVRIQDLQMADSLSGSSVFLQATEARTGGAAAFGSSPFITADRPVVDPRVHRLFAAAGGRITAFFLPEAQAGERLWAESAGSGSPSSPQITTTTFSEGEAVSYALTSDAEGNLIVVGTADGEGASSIVAARFVAEDLVDRITEQPGHRSSHITTTPSEITRTTITIGCDIAASFGKEVVRRGVVFSVNPGPLYEGSAPPDLRATSSIWQPGIDAVAAFFLPEAVAADSGALRSMPTMTGRKGSAAAPSMEVGEATRRSGTSSFVAVMDHLLPGTVYYIRAYALTATGEVYYGNQVTVRTADACFIATASFGTFLHPSVGILRDFRDAFLIHHGVGKWLVDLYYTLSPPLADIIAGSAMLRSTVRMLLLPGVGFSWLALHTGLGTALGGVAAAMVFLAWLMAGGRLRINRRG